MNTVHVGYVDYHDKIYRFARAQCAFENGQLDVEAEGQRCTLKLYGIPFRDAAATSELAGQKFGATCDDIGSDPIAEGGIVLGDNHFSWASLFVRCKNHDVDAKTLSVSFQAEVEEPEWGDKAELDGTVVCTVVDSLFGG